MKKQPIVISAAAMLLLITGCRPSEEEVGAAEPRTKRKPEQPLTLEAISEKNIQGKWQGRDAPHLHRGGFSVEGDLIYWRADEGGLEYATTAGNDVESPNIRWSPGYKVGIGYLFEQHDFWDLFLRWTAFQTKQHGKKEGTLLPWWAPTMVGPSAISASADWKLRYDVIDLELGHDYFISKAIVCRPLVGVRGAAIRQHYKAGYEIPIAADRVPTSFKAKNNFEGIGVRAGAQMGWYFVEDWSIFGTLSGSLLYGRFKVTEHVNGFTSETIKQTLSRVAPNLEAGLGLQWETFLSCDRYRIAITLAYEFSEWFSQNQLSRPELLSSGAIHFDKTYGDLGLQGGTFQVRFDF
jgi:hypothetical protein